jgi:hypothetical protein
MLLNVLFYYCIHEEPGSPLVRFIQWSTWVFVHTGIGRKISNKMAKKFPLGYTVIVEKA